MISVPDGTCPVRGCGGSLRFDVDTIGRMIPICRECERRVDRVRALEQLLLGIRRGDIKVHHLGDDDAR